MNKEYFESFADLVMAYGKSQPEHIACIFQENGPESVQQISYGELAFRIQKRASVLLQHQLEGQSVALIFPASIEFVVDFVACLYVGVIAVPLNLSRNQQQFSRTLDVIEDAGIRGILTTAKTHSLIMNSLQERSYPLDHFLWLDENIIPGEKLTPDKPIRAEDLAFIQYTSGSTSKPKGVMVSQENILANQTAIQEACQHSRGLIAGGWLPQFHDMGLIGHMMQPLYLGGTYVFMPPMNFVQRPRRWLELISNYRIHSSAAPNFGYEHCVKNISEREDLSNLDLSCWKVALNGSEPVNHQTMQKFSKKFSTYGFKNTTFFPCYGMAESTLFISGGAPQSGVKVRQLDNVSFDFGDVMISDQGKTVVSCGRVSPFFDVKIVNPDTKISCLSHQIGEIWVRGTSVAQGYWNNSDQTKKNFSAKIVGDQKNYLRTGDLGFIHDGDLFVTGRIKELLIIRGRNIYPYDIEHTCNGDARAAGTTAVFSVESGGDTQLGVIIEVKKNILLTQDMNDMALDIKGSVMDAHSVAVDHLRLVKPGTIPRTTSGKIRRLLCKDLLLQKEPEAV